MPTRGPAGQKEYATDQTFSLCFLYEKSQPGPPCAFLVWD